MWLLRAIQREHQEKMQQMMFLRNCHGLQILPADPDMQLFKSYWERSAKNLQEMYQAMMPAFNSKEATAAAAQNDLESARKQWELAFGSLDDKEVQEDIAKLAAKMRSKKGKPQDE